MTRRITASEAQAMRDVATPGPWEVDADGCLDVTAESTKHRSFVDTIASVSTEPDVSDRATANACLMAAAPDLVLSVVALTVERDEALSRLTTLTEMVLAERRTREDVHNARTEATRASVRRALYDIDAEPALAAAEVQHAKALKALNECLARQNRA